MPPKLVITRDTFIADVLREYPQCAEVFDRHEMPCQTCMGAATGTVAEGAMMHDVDPDTILAELRQCANASEEPT